MTDLRSIRTISTLVRNQLDALTTIWQNHLGKYLVGVYLHGSLAQESFREGVSDLDVLVVVSRPIPCEERLQIAADIIAIDQVPASLEISAVMDTALWPWRPPVICQFHYSGLWTERYEKRIAGENVENYVADNDFPDDDITSYIAMLHQCGIVLCGNPIVEVFPPVSAEDFWKAISANIADYHFNSYDPRYYASNILILGRILSFKRVGQILSKHAAGLWAQENVPQTYQPVIREAMEIWYGDRETLSQSEETIEGLRQWLIVEIMHEQ